MKKIVEVTEVQGEGLLALMGQNVTIFCNSYIYAGKLIGVNEHDILLSDAKIVYETGGFDTKDFKDAQKLPNNWYIRTSSIESYGVLK